MVYDSYITGPEGIGTGGRGRGITRWLQDDPKMVPRCPRNGPKTALRWPQDELKKLHFEMQLSKMSLGLFSYCPPSLAAPWLSGSWLLRFEHFSDDFEFLKLQGFRLAS